MIIPLSLRYSFSSFSRQRTRSIRTVVTIVLSLTVLSVIISIMDFLQSGRFAVIRDVRSFDICVEGRHKEELSALYPEAVIFEYGEGEALSSGGSYLVRYISPDYEGGLELLAGDTSSLTVPYSLFRSSLSSMTLSMLREGRTTATVRNVEKRVGGVYWTRLGSEFDSTMLFLPTDDADSTVTWLTAMKGVDISLSRELEDMGYCAITWKKAEESLYGAFMLEKAMMYAVLSMLFVIIMVSMRQSVRIFLRAREKELAGLLVMGLGERGTAAVGVLSFLSVSLISVILSLITSILSLRIIESVSRKSDVIMDMALEMPVAGFAVFSFILLLSTSLMVLLERRRAGRKELWEVVNGR